MIMTGGWAQVNHQPPTCSKVTTQKLSPCGSQTPKVAEMFFPFFVKRWTKKNGKEIVIKSKRHGKIERKCTIYLFTSVSGLVWDGEEAVDVVLEVLIVVPVVSALVLYRQRMLYHIISILYHIVFTQYLQYIFFLLF